MLKIAPLSDSAKKAIAMFTGLAFLIGLVFLVLNLVIRRPDNHQTNSPWQPVHLQLEGFDARHQGLAQTSVAELNRLGPTFVIGGEGQNVIRVVSADLTDGHPGHCRMNGRFVQEELTGRSWVEIDPTCTQGDMVFQTVFIHEVGHALGMEHVCRVQESGVRTDCSPVGHGIASMNPSVLMDDAVPADITVLYSPPVPAWQVQSLDIQEFKRIQRLGRLNIH